MAPNVLARDFSVDAPNRTWMTDITSVWTRQGWRYLAVVLDLSLGWWLAGPWGRSSTATWYWGRSTWHSRRVGLHWGCCTTRTGGSQYASEDYQQALAVRGIECSMRRKGNCWDNAVAESFFSTLKMQLVHGADFATRDQARAALFESMEVCYNRQRRHRRGDSRLVKSGNQAA